MSDDPHDSPYAPPKSPKEPSPLHWSTWSPRQTDEVRQILANMTELEKRRLTMSGLRFGICFGITFCVPVTLLMYGLSAGSFYSWSVIIGATLVISHYAYVPWWVRRQTRLLCSTEWARRNGITPQNLQFRRGNSHSTVG